MAAASIPARFDENRRSSARLPLRLPVLIKGTDISGNPFSEQTHTVVINRGGAKILTSQLLAPGSQIQVTVAKLKRQSQARVVWWRERKGEKNEAGIDIEDKSGNLWEVQFPDGNEVPAPLVLTTGPNEQRDPREPRAPAPAASAPAVRPPPQPAAQAEGPTKLPEAVRELVRSAVDEKLSGALQQFNSQMQAIVERAEKETLEEFKDLMGHAVMSALERLEARVRESLERNEQVGKETLARLAKEAEKQWTARLAEYEARIAASTQKARQDLAQALANLGNVFGKPQ